MSNERTPRGVVVTSTHGTIDNGGTLQVAMAANHERVGGLIVNLDGTASLGVYVGAHNIMGATTLEIPIGPGLGFSLGSLAVDNRCYQGEVSVDGTSSKAFLVVESTAAG